MSTENVRRASIECYNASENMLINFTIPRERSGGKYTVKCMVSAFDQASGHAFIYAEFERVKTHLLMRALERHGATGIRVDSFTLQDYLTGAGDALRFVLDKAIVPGFRLIEIGSPSIAPAPTADPASSFELGSYSLEVVKALEQAVDAGEERAQKLEEELSLKDDELRRSNEEKQTLVYMF